MPRKRYPVTLKADEEKLLHEILGRGRHGAQKRRRAQAPLLADEGYTDEMIAERARMHRRAVESLRQRFVEDGFEETLEGKARGHRPRALQGKDDARLIAPACGPAPEGGTRRTLRLLKDRRVTLENTDTKTVSHETIRQALKKTHLKPRQSREWCIPPEANAEFVACMEDVPDVYTREGDEKRPLVCMDECPKQVIGETRTPLPGKPICFDSEYMRNGICNIFVCGSPGGLEEGGDKGAAEAGGLGGTD